MGFSYSSLVKQQQKQQALEASWTLANPLMKPDEAGAVFEAGPITRPGGMTSVSELALQTNQKALEYATGLVDWMRQDTEVFPSLVAQEVSPLVDFEKSVDNALSTINGRGAALARNVWMGAAEIGMGVKKFAGANQLKQLEDKLAALTAINGGATPEDMAGDPSVQSLMRLYQVIPQERRDAMMASFYKDYIRSDQGYEKLTQTMDEWSMARQSYLLGRQGDFSDIRDAKSLLDWVVVQGGSGLASVVEFATIGALTGGAGLLPFSYLMELGDIAGQADLRDPNDPNAAGRVALFASAASLVELGFGAPARFLGNLGMGARGAMRGVSREVQKRAVQGYARRIGKEAVGSAVEEFAQEFVQFYLEQMGAEGSDFEFNDENLLAAFNAGMVGLFAGGGFGTVANIRGQVALEKEAYRLRDAGHIVRSVEELAAVRADLKLPSLSPKAFKSLADHLGLGNTRFFFQPEAVQQYLEESGVDLDQALEQLGIDSSDFMQAAVNGNPIAISGTGLVRALDGTNTEFWASNAMARPDGGSQVDFENLPQARQAILQEIRDQMQVGAKSPTREALVEQIVGAFAGAGLPDGISPEQANAAAVPIAAIFETLAARYSAGGTDMSGADLFEKYGFQIQQALADAPTTAPAGTVTPNPTAPVGGEAVMYQSPLANDRALLQQTINQGATPQQLLEHPVLMSALAEMKSIPETMTEEEAGVLDNYTNRSYTDDVSGEALTFHDMIQRVDEGSRAFAKGPVQQGRRVDILIGPPAAGKSTIAERIAPEIGARIVDADEVKPYIPGFKKGIGALAVHEESSAIAKMLLQTAMQAGDNIVLPKVGENPAKMSGLIRMFKEAGYTVNLVNMSVSRDEAFRRMIGRFISKGRLVPPSYAYEGVGERPAATYEQIKGEADGYANFDAEVPLGQPARVIEDTRRGGPDGRPAAGGLGGGQAANVNARATGGDQTLYQSAALHQVEPLEVEGTGKNGKVKKQDVARAFTERHMELHGRKFDPVNDATDFEIVVDELYNEYEEQLGQHDTGHGWYTADIAEAIRVTKQLIPELNDPIKRDLFMALAAVTSPRERPFQNWAKAVDAMQQYLRDGRMPALKQNGKRYGVEGVENGIKLLQHLIDTLGGEAQALAWLTTEHTGAELAQVRKDSGIFKEKKRVAEYLPSEVTLRDVELGFSVIGPKVSDFYYNASGIDQTAVTVDMWLAQTYNRHIGRLLDIGPADLEAGGVASQPRGRNEREVIKAIVRAAADRAGIEPSAMQAAMWYFEQRLERSHGVNAVSQNFSGAARNVVERAGVAGAGEAQVLEQGAAGAVDAQRDGGRRDPGRADGFGTDVRDAGGSGSGVVAVDPETFVATARAALAAMGPVAGQVGTDPGEQAFLLDDGASGYALDGDNIISVFSSPDSPPGVASRVLQDAVARGGRRLDGFDTFLPPLYAKYGFRAVARLAFNDEYAPTREGGAGADWDVGVMGRPDVVFMVYDPANASPATDNVVEDYDAGVAAQDAALADLEQTMHQGPRGQITLPAAGLEAGAVIKLFEGADVSTILHESGHYFLELFKTLSIDPNAPQQMRDDFAALNEWLGHSDPTATYTTAQHEQFAEAFEKYMMEGRAPSVAMQGVFSLFKRWLTKIYQAIPALQVNLTPEVRDIFDRMLATDEEIELAKIEENMGPLLIQKPAGMADADYEAYRRSAALTDAEASEKLLTKAMDTVKRRRTEAFKKERAALIEKHTADLQGQPVYRLLAKMEADGVKLNRKEIVEQFGQEVADDLQKYGRGKRAILTNTGASIEAVAELSGYPSADDMITDLYVMRPLAEEAAARAADEMELTEPDVMVDGTMREEAIASLHNSRRWRTLQLEASEIRRQIEEAGGVPPASATTEELRALARAMISDMTVVNAENPEAFLRVERQANRAARVAYARVHRAAEGAKLSTSAVQDLMEAHAQTRRALLNSLLYAEAKGVQKTVDQIKRQEKRLRKAANRGKIASPFRENIISLLQQYDFRKLSAKETFKRHELAKLVKQLRDGGYEDVLAVRPDIVAKVERMPYKGLTVAQLRNLKDTLDNLEQLGRKEIKLLVGERDAAYFEVKRNALTQLAFHPDVDPSLSGTRAENRAANAKLTINTFSTADTVIRKIDGDEDLGYFWSVTKQPISRAYSKFVMRQKEAMQKIDAIFREHYGDRTKLNMKSVFRPEVNGSMTQAEVLAVALNTGNIENMQRLVSGQHKIRFTDQNVQALLDNHMSEADWRFVQAFWDEINSYWGEVAEHQRRLTGVYPKKVEAKLMVSAPSFVRGGYYPIRYDPRLSANVTENDYNEAFDNLRSGRASRAQTSHGHTEERMRNVEKPLLLNLSVGVAHINDVLFDLSLREPVQSVWRLLNDKDVSEAFKQKGLEADRDALVMWVQDVAVGDRQPARGLNAALRHLRTGLSVAKMGFSFTTMVQQPLGLIQSSVVLGGNFRITKAIGKYLSDPRRYVQAAVSSSPFMAERWDTFQREMVVISGMLDEDPVIGKWNAIQRAFVKVGFAGIQALQFYTVDVPTWLAAYDKMIEEGHAEQDAVDRADALLARAQGSGILSDRSAIERGTISKDDRFNEFARMATTFGSYMIGGKLNVAAQQIRAADLTDPVQAMRLMYDLILLYGVETMAALWLTGRWFDDDEDKEGLAWWMAQETAFAVMGSIPLARDMAGFFQGFDSGGAQGQVISGAAKAVHGTAQLAGYPVGLTDPDKLRTATREFLSGIGILTHMPTVQLERLLTASVERDLSLRDDFSAWDLAFGRKD